MLLERLEVPDAQAAEERRVQLWVSEGRVRGSCSVPSLPVRSSSPSTTHCRLSPSTPQRRPSEETSRRPRPQKRIWRGTSPLRVLRARKEVVEAGVGDEEGAKVEEVEAVEVEVWDL